MKAKRLSRTTRQNLITYAIVLVAFAVVTLMNLTGSLSNSLEGQLVPICTYVMLAVSLNLTVGILGELSLGHAGFMSVGAFSAMCFSDWRHCSRYCGRADWHSGAAPAGRLSGHCDAGIWRNY